MGIYELFVYTASDMVCGVDYFLFVAFCRTYDYLVVFAGFLDDLVVFVGFLLLFKLINVVINLPTREVFLIRVF